MTKEGNKSKNITIKIQEMSRDENKKKSRKWTVNNSHKISSNSVTITHYFRHKCLKDLV